MDVECDYLKKFLRDEKAVFITDHGVLLPFEAKRIKAPDIYTGSFISKVIPEIVLSGLSLYYLSWIHPNSAFLTFGNMPGTYLFMALQYLTLPVRKPRTHFLFDCLWEDGKSIQRRGIRYLRSILVNRCASKCIVYGIRDVQAFEKYLGIREGKILYIRYHDTVGDISKRITISDGDYIFSAGTPQRDYNILIRICKDIGIPLKIATYDKAIIGMSGDSPLFDFKSTTHDQLIDLMAKSRMVVLPFTKSFRTGGHQTILNAMRLGKPVIVYNEDVADGYVENGINGITVNYGDEERLGEYIRKIYFDNDYRETLGLNAKNWAENNAFTQSEWVKEVYNRLAKAYYS